MPPRGCSLGVKLQPSKLATRVRFPPPALFRPGPAGSWERIPCLPLKTPWPLHAEFYAVLSVLAAPWGRIDSATKGISVRSGSVEQACFGDSPVVREHRTGQQDVPSLQAFQQPPRQRRSPPSACCRGAPSPLPACHQRRVQTRAKTHRMPLLAIPVHDSPLVGPIALTTISPAGRLVLPHLYRSKTQRIGKCHPCCTSINHWISSVPARPNMFIELLLHPDGKPRVCVLRTEDRLCDLQ